MTAEQVLKEIIDQACIGTSGAVIIPTAAWNLVKAYRVEASRRHLTVKDLNPEDSEPHEATHIATMVEADRAIAGRVINANVNDDGRSPWMWVRFANGDLMLACWPRGETYVMTEKDPNRP